MFVHQDLSGEAAKMLKVAIIVIPEAFPHSITEPLDVFTRCQSIYQKRTGQYADQKPSVSLVAESKDVKINFNGIQITPTDDMSGSTRYDIIWIPSLMVDQDLSYRARRRVVQWIRDQAKSGAEIATVCTGAFLLAETGLLNHRSTTLHWSFTDLFSKTYPQVLVKPHVPIVHHQNIYSAAANSEWITLVTEILEKWYGKAFSSKTAEMFIFNSYKGKKAKLYDWKYLNHTQDAIVAKTQAWLTEHISEDNLISRAATEIGLSESALSRRFKLAHCESVISYVQHVRVERAKEALELTKMPVEQISDLVGYSDSSYFRRLFKGRTGMTPKQYRKHYSA